MKKLLVAGIAACAGVFISSAAIAQPMPVSARYAGEWSGFYIGVNGGAMNFTTNGSIAPPFEFDLWRTERKQISLAGIHGGFQGQWGNWVLGIEGAWEGTLGDQFGSRSGDGVAGAPCSLDVTFACQARINDILSVGPRVGFAMKQWMVYGSAGYARAEIQSQITVIATGSPLGLQPSAHHDGWYYSGGLEMLVMHGFVIGVEYKHYDFKKALHFDTGGDSTIFKANADAVLLRLTIKGGG